MTPLTMIGYWRRKDRPEWPDPHEYLQPDQDELELEYVANYLEMGTVLRAFMGRSRCRICGVHNGSMELTDGEFAWPEGLAHYLRAHGLRLPEPLHQRLLAKSRALEETKTSLEAWVQMTQSGPGPVAPRAAGARAWSDPLRDERIDVLGEDWETRYGREPDELVRLVLRARWLSPTVSQSRVSPHVGAYCQIRWQRHPQESQDWRGQGCQIASVERDPEEGLVRLVVLLTLPMPKAWLAEPLVELTSGWRVLAVGRIVDAGPRRR